MRRFIQGGLVAVALTCASLPAVTRAADVTTWQYTGQSANAQFFSTDPSGCIFTVVTVAAYDGRITQEGQPANESAARVAVQQYDSCTHTDLFLGNNETSVLADAFLINQQRTSATLQATINVEEYVSGKTFPVTVNLSWTANGNAVDIHKRYQVAAPGLRIVEHALGTVQPAVVSGTVSVADGPNLTPDAAQNDQVTMSSVKQGTVHITR